MSGSDDQYQSDTKAALYADYVAIPESRQLDILVDLLESRGARVLRLPLVSILDAPDPAPINAWLHSFIANPGEYLIVLTGEGIRRLRGFASRAGCEAEFIAALNLVCKICRGPKPGRALKEIGLKPDLEGVQPTTAGIIQTLETLDLSGRQVGVQLYGEDPNHLLVNYLHHRNAKVTTVAPYIYAPHTDEQLVVEFIRNLPSSGLTAMCFTSQPQYHRLQQIAAKYSLNETLHTGLQTLKIVAVGPVVAEQLRAAGLTVEIMPESSFFMKPMVMALVRNRREEK